MSVLIKVLGGSIVGVLTAGLIGCGCLFPSTLSTLHSLNPYPDLYKAEELRYSGKYRKAIAKYEQALKKFPHFPVATKVVDVSFPTVLKYYIAFCYTKLAEVESDVSLYTKAEGAARESYQAAIIPSDRADALYLWSYILFKQARYEQARSKFEALMGRLQQNEFDDTLTADALFGLGKVYMGLGDESAARQTFAQFEEQLESLLPWYGAGALYGLGKVYMELGDKPAAQRVFAQLLKHFPNSSHKAEVQRLLEKQ